MMPPKSPVIKKFLSSLLDVFFEKRCLSCGNKSPHLLCGLCLKELRLDEGEGKKAYLFEASDVASALIYSPLASAQKVVAAYINIRLEQLGWEVGHVTARCEELQRVARLLFTHENRAALAIDIERGRLTLDLIE